ncbi:hypothetical protein B9Z55_016545 [Caenorhabditis nigoni]|uniref:Glycosyltransferase family 92 protein n=1 Tax=Caenorhabditis nigoni TaxID=1611254 RepID=A0A2G5T5J1_9PELO|nr:hypothetical protein B9Z55_016545 [Caenorhabditis nigoni]
MRVIQRYKGVLVTLIIVVLIFYAYELDDEYLETVGELLSIVAGEPINSSFPITFYQSAYVDHRFDPPRLRIFTINKCLKNYQFLLADLHFNVTIHLGSRKVELNVEKIYKKATKGITVCLQPVYYFSHWQNILLFIEAWRAQGATRFIVYFHSATKETWKVLAYYRDLGLVEIKHWPSFPSFPVDIAYKYPRIDDSVLRNAYFLAMNICILDIKTTFGTVPDFDEVLVPTNGRLLDYAIKEMAGTKVGALIFDNHYVSFTPNIYSANFSGVASPKFRTLAWPSKYVFNASVIDIAQVHVPDSFTDPSMISIKADGALLHFRYDAESKNLTTTEKPYRFFPDNHSTHIKNMEDTAKKIFNGVIPKFSSKSNDALHECVNKIMKSEDKICVSTGGLCKAEMDKVEDWVYAKSEPLFLIAI